MEWKHLAKQPDRPHENGQCRYYFMFDTQQESKQESATIFNIQHFLYTHQPEIRKDQLTMQMIHKDQAQSNKTNWPQGQLQTIEVTPQVMYVIRFDCWALYWLTINLA